MPHSSSRYQLLAMMAAAALLAACDREPPFSLGGAERVAEIKSKYSPDDLQLPQAKANSKLKRYAWFPQSGVVLSDKVILNGSEIVGETVMFKTPGPEPLTEREIVSLTVPWASKWTESTVKRIFLSDFTPFDAPLYTATRSGWVAKLHGARGSAQLVVVKLGIPGLDIDDLVPDYTEKLLQKDMPRYKEEEAKMLKQRQEREREREAFDRGE